MTEDELLWELEAAFAAAHAEGLKELEAAILKAAAEQRKAAMKRHPSARGEK